MDFALSFRRADSMATFDTELTKLPILLADKCLEDWLAGSILLSWGRYWKLRLEGENHSCAFEHARKIFSPPLRSEGATVGAREEERNDGALAKVE